MFFLRLSFFLALLGSVMCAPMTIKEYVSLADPTYNYTVTGTFKKKGYTLYNIEVTSGQWLTAADSSVPVWKHTVQCFVPELSLTETAFVYIDGGGNNPPGDKYVNPPFGIAIAIGNGAVACDISSIPNEPIKFPSDPLHQRRTEDAIIAYTWRMFLGGASPEWLLRYPMTRGVVRSFDAIQAFTKTLPLIKDVQNFVVGGASKRGWTTWTTAIVDERVIGAVPIVAPIGNITGSINMHYQLYNGWSFALGDYTEPELSIMDYLDSQKFADMMDLVGIDKYQDVLGRIPKLMITAAGDEFFIITSPRFFWDNLQGEKLLRTVPNAEHSMIGHEADLVACVSSFFTSVVNKHTRPTIEWTIDPKDGSIAVNVTAGPLPETAYIFHATNAHGADFRLITCNPESGGGFNASCINPVFFYPEKIEPVSPGYYVAKREAPPTGYTAFFVQMEFKIGGISDLYAFKATSAASIIPIKPPFPPCPESKCGQIPGPFPPKQGKPMSNVVSRKIIDSN